MKKTHRIDFRLTGKDKDLLKKAGSGCYALGLERLLLMLKKMGINQFKKEIRKWEN